MQKNINYFVIGGLICTTAISGSILFSTNYNSYATDSASASANASVTVGAACSINAATNPAHTTTIANGTSSSDDGFGLTTIKATCNDAGGFSIYAVGWTNDTYGTNTMVGSANSSNVINTGTSGTSSWWAMKVSAIGTAGQPYTPEVQNSFSSWHAVPNAWTEVARYTSATDMGNNATGSTITTTYKASISTTQAADTYIGKVKYILTNPYSTAPSAPVACSGGKICYNPNGSNVVGTMGQQSASNNASVMLLASNFSREGYGFVGWNDKFDYSGNFYGPQETITTPADTSTNGLPLYAVWVKSEGYLQDATTVSSVCNRLTQSGPNIPKTINSVSALTDKRDGQAYAIAKLADDKCWMIENLRLEAEQSSDESLAQGFGGSTTYGNFSGLATAEVPGNFSGTISSSTASTTANSKYYAGTQSGTATINISQTNYAGYRMPRYNNTNTSSRANDPTSNSNTNMFSYGNYYSWPAALANTNYYSSPTATDAGGNTSETADTSICPAGWRLPRGGNKSRENTNEIWSLVVTSLNAGVNPANYDSSDEPYYSSSAEITPLSKALRTYPNNFVFSGYINNNSINNRGSSSAYWSSTVASTYSIYTASYLSIYSSYIYPGTSGSSKYMGMAVRCIVSDT